MSNLTIPNTFANGAGNVANATLMNANFQEVATLLNSTGLNSDGLATNSVTTAKILDSNVTSAKIADSAITTAKIADGAVTQAKKAALGQILSVSSGASTTTSTSFTDMLTATIVTTGRPVMLMIQPDGTATASYIGIAPNSGSPTTVNASMVLRRDGTDIANYKLSISGAASATLSIQEPTNISFIDTGATAASHVYTLAVKTNLTSTTCSVISAQLVAFEL